MIGGFTEPQGSRTGFGALLVGHYEGRRLVYAGKVGTGYDRATLDELWARMDRLERSRSPFAGSAEWTDDGKLRHPRFVGLRTDKPATKVVRERPGEGEEEPMNAEAKTKDEIRVGDRRVPLRTSTRSCSRTTASRRPS